MEISETVAFHCKKKKLSAQRMHLYTAVQV